MQTRLTALDLIGYAAGDERPRQFVHMPEQELEKELVSIKVFPSSHTHMLQCCMYWCAHRVFVFFLALALCYIMQMLLW